MIKIALDMEGSDNSPETEIKGVFETLKEVQNLKLFLITLSKNVPLLKKTFSHYIYEGRVEIIEAKEKISTEDTPFEFARKKDSTISKGIVLHKEGKVHGFLSAGHTVAILFFASSILGKLQGIRKPAIGVFLPDIKLKGVFLIDAGANVEVTPEDLLQFAFMGKTYLENIMGRRNPKIALLSIGREKNKGNKLVLEAYKIFSKTFSENFYGNIESNEIFNGEVDILVTDGFTGNIVLKMIEGSAEFIEKLLKIYLRENPFYLPFIFPLKPLLSKIKKVISFEKYGGAPILGVNGYVFKTHGRATPEAIKNSLKKLYFFVKNDFLKRLKEGGERYGI